MAPVIAPTPSEATNAFEVRDVAAHGGSPVQPEFTSVQVSRVRVVSS